MVISMNLDKYPSGVKKTGLIIVGVLLIYLIVHHFTQSKGPVIQPPLVEVQKPVLASMTQYITQTGTTVAYLSVNLVARVEGYLTAIEFTDGTFVKKNQALFVIQPEPYMEQLKAAQATVAAQKAGYAYAKAEYARQQRMYKENATSLNNVEKWLAKSQESEAEVAKAVANAQIAQINYNYTHVAAPFNGRMGRHLIDVGNLVGNGVATQLATIDQIDTLYVYFNLNEIDLIKLRAAARKRGLKAENRDKIPVDISFQNDTKTRYKATFDFVNTGLNASTGTMELRALLDNKDHLFVPGLFVQVRVAISPPEKQLTVPDTALLYDQIGPYLLVMDKSNTVVLTRVELGAAEQGMRAITKGLNQQDNVIVGGLQSATPGNQVQIKELDSEKTGK